MSRCYRGRGELIDHIVVIRFLARNTTVIATEVTTVQAGGGPFPSIDDDPNSSDAYLGSDPAAVPAPFDF